MNKAQIKSLAHQEIESLLVENRVTGTREEHRVLLMLAFMRGWNCALAKHVCDLPESIKWALNSGDGTYRP